MKDWDPILNYTRMCSTKPPKLTQSIQNKAETPTCLKLDSGRMFTPKGRLIFEASVERQFFRDVKVQ